MQAQNMHGSQFWPEEGKLMISEKFVWHGITYYSEFEDYSNNNVDANNRREKRKPNGNASCSFIYPIQTSKFRKFRSDGYIACKSII